MFKKNENAENPASANNKKHKKFLNVKGRRAAVFALAAATAVIWLILVCVKFLIAHYAGTPVEFPDFLDSVLDSLLGILPPIILIDFLMESITQDFMADEISEQITATLMSNPEAIALFKRENKINFINTTITTMADDGEDEAQMAINALAPYLPKVVSDQKDAKKSTTSQDGHHFNLKKFFFYDIALSDYINDGFLDPQKYMMVNETLKYEKHYISTEPLANSFHIGFFVDNSSLDKQLRAEDFLFRESLSIYEEDLIRLTKLSKEEGLAFVENEMVLRVDIDKTPCKITDVVISDWGIDITFYSNHDCKKKDIFIHTSFCMPQIRDRATFFVSIAEPAYDVNVRFTYPRNDYRVTMYPFFNDASDALVEEVDRGVGICDIHIRNKWVYPISGVVFNIDPAVSKTPCIAAPEAE